MDNEGVISVTIGDSIIIIIIIIIIRQTANPN